MITGQMMVRRFAYILLFFSMVFGGPALVQGQETAAPAAEHVNTETGADEHVAVATTEVAPDVHAEHGEHAAEGEAHEAESEAPELPTFIHIINHIKLSDGSHFGDTAFGHFLHDYQWQIYLLMVTGFLALMFFGTLRILATRPGKFQVAVEMLAEGLSNFFTGIVGREHAKHVPFLCSLFLFIWINNMMSLVPLMGAATSKFQTTVTLALLVFFYFIFYGIKDGGLGHFLWHMAGSPRDVIGWVISPVLFVLEIVGNLAKPLSLSLRLFGNIMGEDILLGVFLLLGLMMAGAVTPDPIIGVPLHLPFLFLVMLTSTIQALVFSLLAAIYIAMVLPHHEHEHEHVDGDDKHPLFPGAEEENENSGHIDASATPFVG